MKKTLLLFLPVFIITIAIISCGDNTTGTGLGSVTFTMGTQQGPNGGTQFTWSPSKSVKVTKLILGTTGFSDTITDNSGTVYTGNQTWAYPNEYTGVTTGQQWTFNFTGTDSSNQAYTSTANLTIP
ncbi:MAG: hypothetical protein IT280_12660 [Ignavibacteria bacterium]|nr:hypothetical protein [Ignavibacteria bacterium]